MIAGGENDAHANLNDVEIIDLSSPISIPCFVPNQLPMGTNGLVGTFINGMPHVCGGRTTSNCYRYNYPKSIDDMLAKCVSKFNKTSYLQLILQL